MPDSRPFLGNPTTRVVLLVLGVQTVILFMYCNQRSAVNVSSDTLRRAPPRIDPMMDGFDISKYDAEETTTIITYPSTKPTEIPGPKAAVKSEVKAELEDPYEAVNTYWVNHIKGYCSLYKDKVPSFPDSQFKGQGVPSWVWMDSPKHHLFYCAAPKCSSTTWKTYLLGDLNITYKGDPHTAATRLGAIKPIQKAHMTDNFSAFLDNYRPDNRFLIVRNPWARLVSAYENKMVIEKWTLGHLCIAGSKFPNKGSNHTFKIFMECLAQSDRTRMWNSHIHPYTSLCVLCHMEYNLIVKLEEMDKAEPFIRKVLNFTSLPKYKPPVKGKYTNTYASHYSDLEPETITALRDIYKDDIELFDYPRSPFD